MTTRSPGVSTPTRFMSTVLCALVLIMSGASPASAQHLGGFSAAPSILEGQSFDQFDQGAKSAGKSIVSVIVNVIFIILALACVGYGVAQLLAGRIGLFVLCIVGAVVLALAPEFIGKTFQATNSSSLIKDR